MDVQVQRIKSDRYATPMKNSLPTFRFFIIGLYILCASNQLVQASTCKSSVPNSAEIMTDQYSFSGYTTVRTYSVVAGPVSKSLYYLSRITSSSENAEVRRMDSSNYLTWQASFAFYPIVKSLSVDSTEQNVYLARYTIPLAVIRLSASDGLITSQQIFNNINGNNYDIKIWPNADNSGYFFIGYDSSPPNYAMICKYTFSPSNAQCQSINNIQFSYGQLMISSDQFFMISTDLSPGNLHMFKFTFSNTSVDWSRKIVCSLVSCYTSFSESLLSADSSTIYLLFSYGSATSKYMNFVTLSTSDGTAVNTRYKSSATVANVWGLVLIGDSIVAATEFPQSLIVYNLTSLNFTIKSLSIVLYGLGVEPSSNRLIGIGKKSGIGYTTKLPIQSIDSHSDFLAGTYSMNTLLAGTDDIVSESGVTIGTINIYLSIVAGTYSNQTVTYSLVYSSTFNSNDQTSAQTLSITEENSLNLAPSLPCSFLGTTSISYNLESYSDSNIPSFISLDSLTGVISISAPKLSATTDYYFYVISSISGVASQVKSMIRLTIKKCTASNCMKCSATDSSVCTSCNSGYNLNSGACSLPESDNGKLLSMTCQVCMGVIVLLSLASSLMNISSFASLWSMINQMQLFFLLFLTGAFIPKDIENIITGFKVCMSPFIYLQFTGIRSANYVYEFFDFGLGNSNLEKLGIKSDSTFINIYSVIVSILIICVSHLCIMLFHKLLMKESKSECCNYTLSITHWILNKLMIFLTFALYIRILLETNQFVFISSVSEIYIFNHLGIKRIISIVIAILILIGCITIILFTFYLVLTQAINKYQESPDNRSKFAQLFTGVSKNKKSRLYVVFVQLRRTIFVILLVTVEPVSSILVISILVGLQLIYLCVLIFIRPFELTKCNIIEITNEIYFLTMLGSLFKYNSVTSWEGTPTTIYTWFMTSSCFLGLLIVFADFVRKIIKKCISKHRSERTEPIQNNNIQQIDANRISNTLNVVESSNVEINKINPTINFQFDPAGRRQGIGNRVYVKR